ncbi:DUF1508 domain-containing protein [Mycolicibacterium neoaurum]|uniref:YegP family protein n=1 Tax=Mycolicibacterium neoaurum TaxID=1795 RepID=UPI00248B318F|nr:DUF1508 domain-containing protein [Mycolicibacterium neoaurum]WBP93201.1 DUF1508 domain-containing protein [Mycolicibacterium neoaurum]WBS06832.1 DUF1508 domain-containing protein [Mycolicibacterium neoaurum]
MRAAAAGSRQREEHSRASDESRFVIRRSSDGQCYLILGARNGKILVTSETYKQKAGSPNGILAVTEVAHGAGIVDMNDNQLVSSFGHTVDPAARRSPSALPDTLRQ